MAVGLAKLKKRADFLRVAGARRKAVRPGVIVQAAVRPNDTRVDGDLRVGFTASRKVGNAVARNRAKRRLRAAAAAVLRSQGVAGTDYVLIARSTTPDRPYPELLADLRAALRHIDGGGRRRKARGAAEE
jgi:ribonuclease P protein component